MQVARPLCFAQELTNTQLAVDVPGRAQMLYAWYTHTWPYTPIHNVYMGQKLLLPYAALAALPTEDQGACFVQGNKRGGQGLAQQCGGQQGRAATCVKVSSALACVVFFVPCTYTTS